MNSWAAIANAAQSERDNLLQQDLIDRARARDILELATQSGARLKKSGVGEYVGSCPVCGGTDRFAVSAKKNIFNCRGCCVGGDAIELARHVRGVSFREAVQELVGEMADSGVKQDPERARRESERLAREADERAAKTAEALKIWNESSTTAGTPAEAYLRSRAIVLDEPIEALRYHPKLWAGGHGWMQALIALFRDIETNEPKAISRIFLDPGGNKFERRFLGPVASCAVKLDADDDVTTGLHIGEGVETCLGARQLGLKPTWALGSAGAIGVFPTLSGIQTLTFLRERDKDDLKTPDAANAAGVAKCAARWRDAGREVFSAWPPSWATDFNDAVRGRK